MGLPGLGEAREHVASAMTRLDRVSTRSTCCASERDARECRSGGVTRGFFLKGMHTYYSSALALIVSGDRHPLKEIADGPQKWEGVWVYHPRSKGERRDGVQGRWRLLSGFHYAAEVFCEAGPLAEVGRRDGDRDRDSRWCLYLTKRESCQALGVKEKEREQEEEEGLES